MIYDQSRFRNRTPSLLKNVHFLAKSSTAGIQRIRGYNKRGKSEYLMPRNQEIWGSSGIRKWWANGKEIAPVVTSTGNVRMFSPNLYRKFAGDISNFIVNRKTADYFNTSVGIVVISTLTRTRTRASSNPDDTETNAAGKSGNARALRKQSKCGVYQ